MNPAGSRLKKKILDHEARIAVIGLGYVGLPLAVEFARAGFRVLGIDRDERKVATLQKGKSYILDVSSKETAAAVKAGRLKASLGYDALKQADIAIVCVPTPLNRTKDPDMSYINAAKDELKKRLRRGMLIVLESTTYPGTTDEVIRPALEEGGLRAGEDFFLCFSPERIDPANPEFRAADIPKVVGGTTPLCTELGGLLYSRIIREVHRVSSTRVAEMAKLIENTFRIVNIGLVNELAVVSQRLGIDIWEAIEAASTKPFGYMPFYPGPGIGGHCIGVDPVYLSWKAKVHGGETHFIDLASRINSEMPQNVVGRVSEILNRAGRPLKLSRILILGVSYKKDVDDLRESPALEIIELLRDHGARVSYHDPFVPRLALDAHALRSVPLTRAAVRRSDLVLIVTNHSSVDYEFLFREARLIFDTRNAMKEFTPSPKVVKL